MMKACHPAVRPSAEEPPVNIIAPSLAALAMSGAAALQAAVASPPAADAAQPAATVAVAPATSVAQRDGRHDFEWLAGNWHATFRRLRHPLTGSHEWYAFDGELSVRPFWDGRGNFESGRLNSPLGTIDSATLRLYDEKTRQWSIYWATAKGGLGLPPEVGSFDEHGIGTFYCWHDTFEGRPIASRYIWTPVGAPNHYHFEQAFSTDAGATWEVNWISDVYRR
jgi:hypothetical protein